MLPKRRRVLNQSSSDSVSTFRTGWTESSKSKDGWESLIKKEQCEKQFQGGKHEVFQQH